MLDGAAIIIRKKIEQGLTQRQIREAEALQCYRTWADFIPILDIGYYVNAVYNTVKEPPAS